MGLAAPLGTGGRTGRWVPAHGGAVSPAVLVPGTLVGAVLVPGTSVGAMLAGALIAGVLDIGVSIGDLDTLVQAQGDDGTVLVFGGDLDFEQIRDELDDARYDDDDYQGYEIWDDGDLWVKAAALLDGRGEVVIGNTDAVEGVLKALSRGSRSLLQDDDNDLRRALERAGQGWVVFVLEGCQGADVRGCKAVGVAVSEGSESYLVETTFAYLFRNERTAESELEDLEDYLDDEFSRDVDIEEVKTDGVFVIVTVSVDEDIWSGVFP